MRTCSSCKQAHPLEMFAFINKQQNKLHYRCNDCRRKAAKKSYAKHRESTVAKVVARNKQKRSWLQEIKSTLSCCVCGETDVSCLDFHHVDASEKDFEVSVAVQQASRRALIEEINKCACLCANCHRKHHAGRLKAPLVKLDIMQSYEV